MADSEENYVDRNHCPCDEYEVLTSSMDLDFYQIFQIRMNHHYINQKLIRAMFIECQNNAGKNITSK
jgi:hypothetical protein